MSTLPRVAHLVSHPIQYFAPLYRELARRGAVDLTVFFRSTRGLVARVDPGFGQRTRWDVPLMEGYRCKFLRGAEREQAGTVRSLTGLDLGRHLAAGRYDVLWVHGYSHPVNLFVAGVAQALGMPVLLRDEATLLDARPRTRRLAKALVLRPLMRRIAGGLYIGQHNRAWYAHYGLSEDRLFPVPYCVDNGFFRAEAQRLASRRAALRRQFGFGPEQVVFLFAGKLVPKKAPLDLARALAMVQRTQPAAALFAGDGPLRSALERTIREEHLRDVTITGFLNQSRIGEAYAASDALVLPSRFDETWGLVVNEAMNFALPVIVTDKVGCAADLVRPGVNGAIVPAGDIEALAARMAGLAGDPGQRHTFGARSRESIAAYDVPAAAAGIERACHAVASPARQHA